MIEALSLADANAVREPGFIERVKVALGLTQDAQVRLERTSLTAEGGREVLFSTTQSRLEGPEYGVANGVVVDEPATASLKFDSSGACISWHFDANDPAHWNAVRDQVKKLVAADEIYLAAPGQAIDVKVLRAKNKPWYVESDVQGRKRLKRAYMS